MPRLILITLSCKKGLAHTEDQSPVKPEVQHHLQSAQSKCHWRGHSVGWTLRPCPVSSTLILQRPKNVHCLLSFINLQITCCQIASTFPWPPPWSTVYSMNCHGNSCFGSYRSIPKWFWCGNIYYNPLQIGLGLFWVSSLSVVSQSDMLSKQRSC